MKIFKNFEWDLSNVKMEKAKEHRVQIVMECAYKWGNGWASPEARESWEKSVHKALITEAGYKFIDDDYIGSREIGNKMKLFLHPQELIGYAQPKDIEKLVSVLEKLPEIYSVKVHQDYEVFAMRDYEYKKLIINHTQQITDCIANYIANGGKDTYDLGFDFAKECRIERYGDGVGYFGDDIDIRTVQDIYEIAKQLGEFDKDKEMNSIDDTLEQEGPELD